MADGTRSGSFNLRCFVHHRPRAFSLFSTGSKACDHCRKQRSGVVLKVASGSKPKYWQTCFVLFQLFVLFCLLLYISHTPGPTILSHLVLATYCTVLVQKNSSISGSYIRYLLLCILLTTL